jgi:hypothetical protein
VPDRKKIKAKDSPLNPPPGSNPLVDGTKKNLQKEAHANVTVALNCPRRKIFRAFCQQSPFPHTIPPLRSIFSDFD